MSDCQLTLDERKRMVAELSVAVRAQDLGIYALHHGQDGLCQFVMDLDAVLGVDELERLLLEDDVSFAHDVNGIRAYLDRDTCELTGGFLPRCGTCDVKPRWWTELHGGAL